MKTVLTDNSLCVYTIKDDADPEHISRYIRMLADAGVRYMELDFRTLVRVKRLPPGMGYILRPIDPRFMSLAELYNFNYIVLSLRELQESGGIYGSCGIPAIMEISSSRGLSRKVYSYIRHQFPGEITEVRVRGSFPYMSRHDANGYVNFLKNEFPVPIDILTQNGQRTALDTAVKFSQAGIDSLTLTMGVHERYCSLDEFLFTLMTVYDRLPREFDIHALCGAAVYQRMIFKNCEGGDGMLRMLDQLDHDIFFLRNADTGARVPVKVTLKDKAFIKKTFVSALERMAREEDIPSDIFEEITEAINRFDVSLFNGKLLDGRRRTFLN